MRTKTILQRQSRIPKKKIVRLSTLVSVSIGVSLLLYGWFLWQVSSVSLSENNKALSTHASSWTRDQRQQQKQQLQPLMIVPSIEQVRNFSSVDYMACCGAGHRISKLSDAYYASKVVLGFSLRSFWGYCDGTREVYSFLFGPQPPNELREVRSFNHFVRLNNEVPGFGKFTRNPQETCPCNMHKAQVDVEFYSQHRNRFQAKHKVEAFRREHFWPNATVVGMQIRAGNGETGDFADRGRPITNPDKWIRRVVDRVLEQKWGKPHLVVFIATDTASMVAKVRDLLKDETSVSVVDLFQIRPQEGQGVMFGERGKVVNTGIKCQRTWESTFMDMMLLSHADVVTAARPSSFTQSMPMSLVLATPKETRKVAKSYCEMNPAATEIRCYEDFRDWCCNGDTEFALGNIHQRYEYLRMPDPVLNEKNPFQIQMRGPDGCAPRPEGWKQPCLPYDFSEYHIVPRKRPKKKPKN